MIALDFTGIQLTLRKSENKAYVFDSVRKKWLVLTPEEHVRQYILQYMILILHYPASLIAVEKTIKVGTLSKRFDIVVFNRKHEPWLLAECKAADVPLTENTLHQLLNYQQTIQCNYWLLTNGHHTLCADAQISGNIQWLSSLPPYDS